MSSKFFLVTLILALHFSPSDARSESLDGLHAPKLCSDIKLRDVEEWSKDPKVLEAKAQGWDLIFIGEAVKSSHELISRKAEHPSNLSAIHSQITFTPIKVFFDPRAVLKSEVNIDLQILDCGQSLGLGHKFLIFSQDYPEFVKQTDGTTIRLRKYSTNCAAYWDLGSAEAIKPSEVGEKVNECRRQ